MYSIKQFPSSPLSSLDEEIISIKRRDVGAHICYFFVKYLRYCEVSIIISEVCHGMLTISHIIRLTQTDNRWILWYLPRWSTALLRLFLTCYMVSTLQCLTKIFINCDKNHQDTSQNIDSIKCPKCIYLKPMLSSEYRLPTAPKYLNAVRCNNKIVRIYKG